MTNNQSGFGDHVIMPYVNEIITSFLYGVIDDRHETLSATGGSVDTVENMVRCQSGTSVGGYGVVRTKKCIIYHPGEAIRSRQTAMFTQGVPLSLQFAGLFSITETIAFGYDGADFGCILERHGLCAAHEIEVTGAASGAESATVTLDGDAVTASLTATTAAGNAYEIARDINADGTAGAKWNAWQNGDKVIVISKSVGDKTGAFSFSSSTATATITEKLAGREKSKVFAPQILWNMNTCDFLDPLKLNIYQIDFGYLGAASITFSVFDHRAGHFVPAHRMELVDQTQTNVGNPSLKIGWASESLGSSGTNLIVKGASASGGKIAIEHHLEAGTRALENGKDSIGTTLTNVLTIRNRGHYNYYYNQGNIKPVSFSFNNDHNKGARVKVVKNANLGGTPNFTYKDESESISEYDTAGTTVTGGEIVESKIVGAGASEEFDLSGVIDVLLPRDSLTIAVEAISGTATTSDVSITWKEDK